MIDNCPIVVDIQIFRFESNFLIENSIVQVSPFFWGELRYSSLCCRCLAFANFSSFCRVFKNPKIWLQFLPTPTLNLLVYPSHVLIIRKAGGRTDIVHIPGESGEPCMFEILKEKNEPWVSVFHKSSICAMCQLIKLLKRIKNWQITDCKNPFTSQSSL